MQQHLMEAERTRFVDLRRRLLELHPDLDDETLADTLEGATNLHEAIAALIRSALDDEALAKALRERMDAMRQRLARFDARSAQKRELALQAMDEAEIRKLVQADFTASLRAGSVSVEILDERQLPPQFLIPQPPKVDKRAVLAALSAGGCVAGAALSSAKLSLSVRTA